MSIFTDKERKDWLAANYNLSELREYTVEQIIEHSQVKFNVVMSSANKTTINIAGIEYKLMSTPEHKKKQLTEACGFLKSEIQFRALQIKQKYCI